MSIIDRYRTMQEELSNDSAEDIAKGATKLDAGKSPVFRGFVSYFPRAMEAIASVSEFGASKYAWNGWKYVPEGFNRYSDAMVRHLGEEGQGEGVDLDSGFPHIYHTAWNSLARLELFLTEQEEREREKERS